MSNVVKASSAVTSSTQFGVIGKVYEELFTDSSGNTMMRYLRLFKASTAVNAGELVGAIGSAVGGTDTMWLQGQCVAIATGGVLRRILYGVSLTAVAAGSYGWCVCRGVVESLEVKTAVLEGAYLKSTNQAGAIETLDSTAAGASEQAVGYCVVAGSTSCTAYITLL